MSKPVRITDTTFRDAHQSILATRMTTQDMEPIAEEMGKAGFYSMDVWGGATYDVAIRFLNEDPWERLRRLKKLLPNMPLQMLIRGQNLVGYRHYADDVVNAFVHHAAEYLAAATAAEGARISPKKLSLLQLLHPAHLGQKFQALHAWRA